MKNHNLATPVSVTDFSAWSSRCWFWRDKTSRGRTKRGVRERERQPLVLSGHGVCLRVDRGTFLVRGGVTHHPQTRDEYRFFPGDLDLPCRIIIVGGSGTISFDVISWLSEQGVALIKIDGRGEIVSVVGNSFYASNRSRVEWQRETRADAKLRIEFCNTLITQKIEASIKTLETAVPRSDAWEKAMIVAYATLTQLEERPPKTVDALRIIEANAAVAYFRAWRGVPIKWAKSRKPIPEAWAWIGCRGSPLHAAGNRHATHPVNAILNYAYTLLQTGIQIKAVADGYDPTIGILHEEREGSAAFVFDLMEPERATVDHAVLTFVLGNTFHPADFVIRSDGVCRLNPEMANVIAGHMSTTGEAQSKRGIGR